MALIDGEHYPPVVEEALLDLERRGHEVLAAVFLGGTEKVADERKTAILGHPIIVEDNAIKAIGRAIDEHRPDAVIDLSDEPIVGYRERFAIASAVLARGVVYLGPDFEFRPPEFVDAATKPALSIIGTGKRVGKTAVSAYACRELKKAGFNPGVVAMGRGGPEEPEIIRGDRLKIDAEYLLEQARRGRHAASDHFEDALMSRIPTVGCRRCGGGFAGRPFISNVVKGARVANELDVDFLIFEGSGAALPPIKTAAKILIAGANQPVDYIIGFLGAFRVLLSDLIILTNCEPAVAEGKLAEIVEGIKAINAGASVVKTVFRPQPLADITGKTVFFATTAPTSVGPVLKEYLEANFKVSVVGTSHYLSNRPRLRADLAACGRDFDVLLTELKAAAVDVATAVGMDLGKQVVYCDNIPLAVDGNSLTEEIVDLAKTVIVRTEERRSGKKAHAG